MNFNPIVLSIPIFFILIGIELLVERFTHRNLYRFPDAIANISCGITSQLSGLFLTIFGIGTYQIIFEKLSFFVLEKTWLYWLGLFLLVDFAYYWAHRMSHEINLFWGGHVVHHQSEDYNLSAPLRQSSIQVIWAFAFSLPIAFLGFQTIDFALISAFITLYRFWIHAETIGKIGWFEYVFNTPSHHRVHHGRDPKYIDNLYMSRFAWLSFLFIIVLESSCGKELPVLDGIDRQAWKDDKNACGEERTKMIDSITSQKEKLLGLSESDVVSLLGKPDRNELYKRNQKFYYYFVQPSEDCDSEFKVGHPARLVVRFNAMGLAKEISVDK